MADVNTDKVIKDLADLDWEKDKNRAAELLKGLFYSKDPKVDKYMQKLSAAATKIHQEMDLKENMISRATALLG